MADERDISVDQSDVEPGISCSDTLEACWLRIALGVTVHRYFLHIDPLLTLLTGAENERRVFLLPKDTGRINSVSSKILGCAIGGLPQADGQLQRLIARDQDAWHLLEVWFEDSTVIITNVESDTELTALDEALILTRSTVVGDIVALGARIFQPYHNANLHTSAPLAGIASFDPCMPPNERASAIVEAACRNLFLLFLLARDEEVVPNLAAAEERLEILTRTYRALVDQIGTSAAVLAGFRSPSPSFSAASIEQFRTAVSTLNYLPAEDLAFTVCKGSWRFDKFASGLGVGQS